MADASSNIPFKALVSSAGIMGLGAPLLIVLLLVMMVLPLPPFALDFLFTFNIALSLIVLLAAVYILRPLDFAVFPTVLLVATLLRLALNIASTRVVLLRGHDGPGAAGRVIEAFGEFVVGGNYAVGLVVFAILVIINFVVVTKGAGRISEVTARFTLDAMPGKQMAIDADLNAGLISQDEARTRRREIADEAGFYGAMDGASKFVRGDAIAGILILFINVIGGFGIGVLQHGLPASQAAANYVLLTIGDGLVAQIPALLLSTAAALIVTRVSAGEEDMGAQIIRQLFDSPRIFIITGGVVGSLGLVPGMPNLVFLALSAALLGMGYYLVNKAKEEKQAAGEGPEGDARDAPRKELGWDDVLNVDVIGLEVGYRLISLVDEKQGGELLGRIKGVRKKLSHELGFLVHSVHIRDNLDLPPNVYQITLHDVPVSRGEVFPGKEMAINPGRVFGEIEGAPGKDPAFGLDAVWIESSLREEAQSKGYTVVDPGTVIATHLSQTLRRHAHELIGHDEVQKLLDSLAKSSPKLVESLVPDIIPLGVVLKVMQNLLEEGVPIRDIRGIAEALAEHGPKGQNPDVLTVAARAALGRTITQGIMGMGAELAVMTLAPEMERILLALVQGERVQGEGTQGENAAGLEPGLSRHFLERLANKSQELEAEGKVPVLLVADAIRLWVSRFVRNTVPDLKVLAYGEIPRDKRIKAVAAIGH